MDIFFLTGKKKNDRAIYVVSIVQLIVLTGSKEYRRYGNNFMRSGHDEVKMLRQYIRIF